MDLQKLNKFITTRLKNVNTRKDDRWKLQDCLDTLNSGKLLDPTQMSFIRSLKRECQERNLRYFQNSLNKKKTKV